MKKILTGAAGVAALALGFAAHAGCVDPRVAAQQGTFEHMAPFALSASHFEGKSAAEKIVGTWHVVYANTEGTTTGEAFIQWHSDGTEWENINYPVLGGNICMGSWLALDQGRVSRNHFGWLYNNGMLAGYFNETETDLLAWDGNSYSGSNDTTLHFYPVPPATEGTTMELKGTAKATRIAP